MATTHSTPTIRPTGVPRKVIISAWTIPLLVLGQFSFVALVPVTVVVVSILRHFRSGALRWAAVALGTSFALPMAIWALRRDPAPSLSKDMSPTFAGLIVTAALGVLVSAYRSNRKDTPASNR